MVPKTRSLPCGWNLHSNGEDGGEKGNECNRAITVVKSAMKETNRAE